MNIALDITPMTNASAGRGVGVYTRELVRALKEFEKEHNYLLFTNKEKPPKPAQLIHYPYFDPFFLTLPLIKRKPTIVTVHDMIPLVFPKQFPRGVKGEVKWQMQKMSLKGARAIITDSEHSKNDIATIVGIQREKIFVVPLAISSEIKRVSDEKKLKDVQDTYHLPSKFIMYVGDINWNKNITGLLQACSIVRKHHSDIHLVLVGKSFSNTNLAEQQEIHAQIDATGLHDVVHMVGGVSNDDLSALYSLATVYVQPSMYEGFGFPILEAMSCGCPVVAGNNSSQIEIAGPSVVVNTKDEKEIAKGIEVVLDMTSEQRHERIQKGIVWSTIYSWKKVAKKTVEVYEHVINHHSNI